jgi:hypothetical protein
MSFRDLRDDDNNDEDFNFDDNLFEDTNTGDDGGYSFDPDGEPDINLDDDNGFDISDDDDLPDDFDGDDDGSTGGGTNRTFVILAAVMILLFVAGLAAVLFLATREQPLTENQMTATFIVAFNATQAEFGNQTATAGAQLVLTQTAQALVPPTATATLVPTDTPTEPPTPTQDETQVAANAILTQQAQLATQQALETETALTQIASVPTLPTLDTNDVALTATALAILLAPGQGGGEATPTQEGGVVPTVGTPGKPLPTAMPQTGFFDDVAAGGSNTGVMALLGLGLLGVIVISRRLRVAADK